jgi:hypothetical protein
MTDHARLLATSLGLRPSVTTDLPLMIEATAQAAWGTDRGHPIATAVVSALRAARVILPAAGVIERAAIAGRAQARTRTASVILADVSDAQVVKLDELLAFDPGVNMTSFAWLRAGPVPCAPTNSNKTRHFIPHSRSLRPSHPIAPPGFGRSR